MNILISACLLGTPCRYDGKGKAYEAARELARHHTLVPICPEVMGGLPTPRDPSERIGDRVVNCCGVDVTREYRRGAEEALRLALAHGCATAVLKERSPSCGSGTIYDGTHTHTLRDGDGVTTELLRKNGIAVYGESSIEKLLRDTKEE